MLLCLLHVEGNTMLKAISDELEHLKITKHLEYTKTLG